MLDSRPRLTSPCALGAGRRQPHAALRAGLGLSYRGSAYHGWQSQPDGRTVQDRVETALCALRRRSRCARVCAGRTDAGVHALNQVVHIDAPVQREPFSWVRGTNRYLPRDIAVQWCRPVATDFHARNSACGRRYAYLLLRVAGAPGARAWPVRLDASGRSTARRCARPRRCLIGEHDFSAFRSSECQARHAGEDAARDRDRAPRRLLALRLRRQRLPAPHGAQHHGLPGRGGQRPPAAGLDGRGAGRARPRRRPRRPSRPTACTSSARTTMPAMTCPSARRRWTGCPDAMPP